MPDSYQICPYTGLRSFTEEESLYFKGREDDIDQATAQLQKNKFLMLTGASGDGKSSLIYAGIIPNARAGFLKSKYSQWCVADFRPERTPFHNLSRSLARQLDIRDVRTAEAELNHGFSALVDLYRNSKRYIDTSSVEWQGADEKSRAAMKRDAANLIVLVDQFEEFFTNPENYQHGSPSRESNLVLNILLETARIALEEDLPIYVVFTMRSDYIGQCAAFRGLPEYLGFSQFFVPRLNRAQLQQVIEEPAVLSGNRISRRLTERLIHDITEGVDQLPILQHALNQIWVAADHGNEEMDLIHYAMVGGMSVHELPDEQVSGFDEWFRTLPPEIKACYHEPNLQNVLDTHTNKLYEQAAGYFTANTGYPISHENAKMIIRTAFTCLTKIDQSRAVRNRMTLEEITNILGNPSFNTKTVSEVLNIFREPGNTFIHPFISETDTDTRNIEPDQVLDITHESLIRNWKYLGQWASEEYESRSISLDFEQQLGRWVNSGKSKNFLLSIGPLTYFENWYNKAKPNAWWIARYLPDEAEKETKLQKAREVLANAQEFLKRSASRHAITRTVMRYGTKKIAMALGLVALVTLTSFAVKSYFSKQNSSVLNAMHEQTLGLVDNHKVSLQIRVFLVTEEMKLGRTTVAEAVNAVKDRVEKINLSTAIATQLVFQGRGEPRQEIINALSISDSLLSDLPVQLTNPDSIALALKEVNDMRATLELAYVYTADPLVDEWRKRNAARASRWVLAIAQKQPAGYSNMQNFNVAMENALNYGAFTQDEIKTLVSIFSPFENTSRSTWVQSNFQQSKLMDRGENGYGFLFNGLYQELAYLYAATGNSGRVLKCIDTLLAYNQRYFQGDYGSMADNATNILSVFYQYHPAGPLDEFVQGYCQRKKIGEEEFYIRAIGRNYRERATAAALNLYWWMDAMLNLNARYCNREQLRFYFDKYRAAVEKITDADQRNLLLAISWKNEGVLLSNTKEKPGTGEPSFTDCFDKALALFRQVSPGYLGQPETIMGLSAADEMVIPRKYIFIYPDLLLKFHPTEPRTFMHFYLTDKFLEYIIDKKLFDSFYTNDDDLKSISEWLANYNVRMFFPVGFLSEKIRYPVLQKLALELERRSAERLHDFNLLYLHLGYEAQQAGEQDKMLAYYRKLVPGNFMNILRTKEYGGNVNNLVFRLMGYAVKGLIQSGHFDEAYTLVSTFKKPSNRSSLYAFAAAEMLVEKGDRNRIQALIDSSRKEMGRISNVQGAQLNRSALAYALSLQDPEGNGEEISRLIKNLPQKLAPLRFNARAMAFNYRLYEAYSGAPALISDDDLASYLWFIESGYGAAQKSVPAGWENYDRNKPQFFIRNINYEDESS